MMGRRRIDWIQFALLLVVLLAVAVHVESRLSRIEQHLTDQDRALEVINGRLQSSDPAARIGPR
jgi:hypothetical protein